MDRIVHDHPEAVDAGVPVSAPVTQRSRITGVRARGEMADYGSMTGLRNFDWSSIVSSVVTGLAITMMLVILGMSTGLIAFDQNGSSGNQAEGFLGTLGAWTVIAALIGTFAGSFVGGRFTRYLNRGSVAYHALASWGLAVLATTLLVCLVTMAFVTPAATSAGSAAGAAAATTATDQAANGGTAGGEATKGENSPAEERAEAGAEKAAEALGGAGVALTLAMLLTLAASFAGWWIGSRKPLTSIETENDAEKA